MAEPASSSKKDLIVCADHEGEESGWTSYFEDFSSNTDSSCFSSCGGGSSPLVSDAASYCAACKSSHHHNHHLLSSLSSNNYGVPPNLPDMKLRFKKSRANLISEDDPLEDTATSPLNSPKDGDLNPSEMISRKTAEHDLYADSTSERFTSENISDSKRDEIPKKTKGKNNMNYKNLKKRGLSLFPLSMLVNYFG
ncbi:vascular-related unknown protein 1-like [Neltuma alba]|uniref:vascular-related unknown protein 1-like n=1 Tax=Neltuma alba TaxID=207710 RepID=UPI0010A41CC4|nr:vascular-related unknown protein 1-like [Prosopis alba]